MVLDFFFRISSTARLLKATLILLNKRSGNTTQFPNLLVAQWLAPTKNSRSTKTWSSVKKTIRSTACCLFDFYDDAACGDSWWSSWLHAIDPCLWSAELTLLVFAFCFHQTDENVGVLVRLVCNIRIYCIWWAGWWLLKKSRQKRVSTALLRMIPDT